MKSYIEESFEDKLKKLRTYESDLYLKWGNRKRIFNMTGVTFEIKFCKAEMMFKESLQKDNPKKKNANVRNDGKSFGSSKHRM